MSFNRKQHKKKVNNYVAKNDFNKGGFHGKSHKQQRSNYKIKITDSVNKLEDEEIYD